VRNKSLAWSNLSLKQVTICSTQLFNQLKKVMDKSKTKSLKAKDFPIQHYFEIIRFPLNPK
jgi:hypothetical protein